MDPYAVGQYGNFDIDLDHWARLRYSLHMCPQ